MNYNNENNMKNSGGFAGRERVRKTASERERRDTHRMQQADEFEPTVLGKGARITGTLEVAGDLIIQGEMQGDINCQSKISATGTIEGNINTADLEMDNAIVSGDIVCTGDMHLSESAMVNGNCEALNVVCGGRIQGDINAFESVTFLEKSALIGNLSARDIEIRKGAVIQGSVTVRQEVFFDTEQ